MKSRWQSECSAPVADDPSGDGKRLLLGPGPSRLTRRPTCICKPPHADAATALAAFRLRRLEALEAAKRRQSSQIAILDSPPAVNDVPTQIPRALLLEHIGDIVQKRSHQIAKTRNLRIL